MDVRTAKVEVGWLCCNAYIEDSRRSEVLLDELHPYENLPLHKSPRDIRRNKKVVLYDHGKPSLGEPKPHPMFANFTTTTVASRAPESGRNHSDMSVEPTHNQQGDCQGPALQPASTCQSSVVIPAQDLQVGDHVRFRDLAGAAVKYQNPKTNGKLIRVPHEHSFDYDVNEWKIVSIAQQAKVLWQDGTVSTLPSTDLRKHTLFETDLAPSDLVVLREGMKMTRREGKRVSDKVEFNEMVFFEKGHELFPDKVGVIQRVDAKERVASVRWYVDPQIILLSSGNILSSKSRLGLLDEEVHEVSLYEVMTFPGLARRRKDPVIIAPRIPSSEALTELKANQYTGHLDTVDVGFGTCHSSQIFQRGHNRDTIAYLRCVAFEQMAGCPEPPQLARKSPNIVDWLGEIVDIRVDGLITVRLGALDACQDVLVPHDQIIAVIDDLAGPSDPWAPDFMDTDDLSYEDDYDGSLMGTPSPIAESVSYEGGERLDNDSGDDNWYSEEEEEDDDVDSSNQPNAANEDVATSQAAQNESRILIPMPRKPTATRRVTSREDLAALESMLPSATPSSFAVLDQEPPRDQFRAHEPSNTSPSLLKRLSKEHRILASSLPKDEIYVRTYESRLDLLRCLIIGPADTPYEHAPFVIDLHLGPTYPLEPPTAHFHSWTSGLGRINPNLYEEGKICLSLLGTWAGKSETEGWSEKASILQILVSLQGLVLVRKPFYNEAGYEGYEEQGAYGLESAQYSEKAFVMARAFVRHALLSPIAGMEDVLAWLYLPHAGNEEGMLAKVVSRGRRLIERSGSGELQDELVDGDGTPGDSTKTFLKPLSKGAIVMLKRTLDRLDELRSSMSIGRQDPGRDGDEDVVMSQD